MAHFGSAWVFSNLAQCRYAFRRHCNMNSGSFFFAEITRTISSFKPGGTVSDSMSVMNPYLYSRPASSSSVSLALFIIEFPVQTPLFTFQTVKEAPQPQAFLTLGF